MHLLKQNKLHRKPLLIKDYAWTSCSLWHKQSCMKWTRCNKPTNNSTLPLPNWSLVTSPTDPLEGATCRKVAKMRAQLNFRTITKNKQLARKYAWVFASGYYLFRRANSFLRANLEENDKLRGTDHIYGQIIENICILNGGHFVQFIHLQIFCSPRDNVFEKLPAKLNWCPLPSVLQ